jgi:hypothetical protein
MQKLPFQDIIGKDVPAVINSLQDIQLKVNDVTDSIKAMAKKVEEGDIATSKVMIMIMIIFQYSMTHSGFLLDFRIN